MIDREEQVIYDTYISAQQHYARIMVHTDIPYYITVVNQRKDVRL